MKKGILSVIACIFMLCFSGCTNNNENTHLEISYAEEFVVGQDSSYMFQMDNNASLITKAEDGYYFRIDGSLYYADNALTALLPLCTITTCKHAGEQSCEAYIGIPALFSNIQYYNGRLYTDSTENLDTLEMYNDSAVYATGYSKLYAISKDARKKNELELVKLTGISPIIHRGYVYCFYTEPVEKDINGNKKTVQYGVLSRINIETGEEERFIDSNTEIISSSDWIQEIYAYRNYVYFVTNSWELYMYDILNDSFEKIDGLRNIRFWFMDDKIIYRNGTGEASEKRKVYIANLDFSNPQYAFTLENESFIVGSDGIYIYADSRFVSYKEKTERVIYYYDKNTYELLGEINLGSNTGLERYGYGDENYYFYVEATEDGKRLMCVVKASLSTGSNIEKRVLLEWQN